MSQRQAKATRRSAAYRLLQLVWKNTCDANGHSWDRVNHAMRDALYLAISAGLRFSRGDFAAFAAEFRSGYWLGNDGGNMLGERTYRHALIHGNQSAALSFEAWKDRPPYIVDRIVGTRHSYSDCHCHPHATGRLALGYRFAWQGHLVTVTSFSDDGQSITACTYKERAFDKDGYPVGSERIARRFKIGIEDLRAEMTRRRKAAKEAKAVREEPTCQ
jgi:hypothetical protein